MPPIGSSHPIRRPEPAAVVRADCSAVLHLQVGDSFLSQRGQNRVLQVKTLLARWLGAGCQKHRGPSRPPRPGGWGRGRRAEPSEEGKVGGFRLASDEAVDGQAAGAKTAAV